MKTLALVLAPWLAGCVSIAPQQLLLESNHWGGGMDPVRVCSGVAAEYLGRQSGPLDEGLDPERISVLNWNIYKGQRQNWADDLRKFSEPHDVLTIQEAHLGEKLATLLGDSRFHWTMNPAFYYRGAPSGVMTAARVKPVYTCGIRSKEPLIRTPKSILIAYYPIAGGKSPLLVANIHGINFTWGTDAFGEQIRALSEVVRHHQGPAIVAGDFNTWSRARTAIVEDMARELGLKALEYANHDRTRLFGNPIDHVFYRGLIPEAQRSWRVTSSDHNPIRVSFKALQNIPEAD